MRIDEGDVIAKRDGNAGGGRRRVNSQQGYDVGIQDATLSVARRNCRRGGAGLVSSSLSCGLAGGRLVSSPLRALLGWYVLDTAPVSSGGQKNRDCKVSEYVRTKF